MNTPNLKSKIPYLDKLGITTVEQQHTPAPHLMPLVFNPKAQTLWDAAIATLKPTATAMNDWAVCIDRFLTFCADSDIYPFSKTKTSSNDLIVRSLKDGRVAVVKYLDKSGIL